MIDLFESEHPNITIVPEYADFASYWDKLSTTAASNDLPDVVQMTIPHIYSYAESGQLANLSDYSDFVKTDEFSDSALDVGRVDDGIYGVPAGGGSFGILADPELFKQAGVELPDASWTWDDYVEISKDISAAVPGVAGTQLSTNEQAFTVWLRQHGQDLWKDDGQKLGFDAETATSWFEQLLDLRDSGGAMSVAATVENMGLGIEASPLVVGKAAMQEVAVNQVGTAEAASGKDYVLLRFPGDEQFDAVGSYVGVGQFYSMAAKTEHPEAAATFIDFLANDVEAGKILQFDRGIPGNAEVLAAITPDLSPADQEVASFFQELGEADPAPLARMNADIGSGLTETITRIQQEVLFDRLTPEQAADQLISELNAAI
ncbi:sugar ABC transporter substrate-binding protein [Microbacterium sp. Marseille-Q6648]|uniref:ABC transporter substrate-binding protein n=1 Tax=Microbacterium sp. Marseille-Q6648 TaxID=2937991 RepID=UPI00203B56C9